MIPEAISHVLSTVIFDFRSPETIVKPRTRACSFSLSLASGVHCSLSHVEALQRVSIFTDAHALSRLLDMSTLRRCEQQKCTHVMLNECAHREHKSAKPQDAHRHTPTHTRQHSRQMHLEPGGYFCVMEIAFKYIQRANGRPTATADANKIEKSQSPRPIQNNNAIERFT